MNAFFKVFKSMSEGWWLYIFILWLFTVDCIRKIKTFDKIILNYYHNPKIILRWIVRFPGKIQSLDIQHYNIIINTSKQSFGAGVYNVRLLFGAQAVEATDGSVIVVCSGVGRAPEYAHLYLL